MKNGDFTTAVKASSTTTWGKSCKNSRRQKSGNKNTDINKNVNIKNHFHLINFAGSQFSNCLTNMNLKKEKKKKPESKHLMMLSIQALRNSCPLTQIKST